MPDPGLRTYRARRRAGRTPEPIPGPSPGTSCRTGRTFVVQEHHASTLHWDFRLERDGVLVSWALPKGVPLDPGHDHLAVPTEDHPLDYASFSGTIPAGEYGGGEVAIWDHGTYECETWTDREVKVVLHGERVEGRYALFAARGRNWMIHRMDAPPVGHAPLPADLSPMLAVAGSLPTGTDDAWAYEFKWDGIRALTWVDGGLPRVVSRNGRDLTHSVPEVRALAEALGSHQVVLDGELVVLDEHGVPSFARVQRRVHADGTSSRRTTDTVSYLLFDLLHLDGRTLLDEPYDERRDRLERLVPAGTSWGVSPSFTGVDPADVLRTSLEAGMEGVVAKRRASVYRPGRRSPDWIKTKGERTQEVVIGGWTEGGGTRRGTFGALVVGIPDGDHGALTFIGKVGTGFGDAARAELLTVLRPLVQDSSPFSPPPPNAVARDATWVRPSVVGEVRFREWTADGRLRHPVWRGLRHDKRAGEVLREP